MVNYSRNCFSVNIVRMPAPPSETEKMAMMHPCQAEPLIQVDDHNAPLSARATDTEKMTSMHPSKPEPLILSGLQCTLLSQNPQYWVDDYNAPL